jgi:uncharacterized protein YggE
MQIQKMFIKTPVGKHIILAALAFFFAAIFAGRGTGRAASPGEAPPSLVVTGHADVAASPDQAIVRLGVLVQATEAADAQTRVSQIMHNALRRLKDVAVADHGIQTTGLSLTPVYIRSDRRQGGNVKEPRIAGYRATNTVTVQVEDLALIGKVIDAGVLAGANQLQGVTFHLREDDKYRRQALQLAAQKAQDKAAALAAAMHVQLGEILEILEEKVHFPRPAGVRSDAAATKAIPVQPGQVRIGADIRVRYRIWGEGK